MKIPKDYVAIPITEYKEIITANAALSRRLKGFEEKIREIHEKAIKKGYGNLLSCEEVARIMAFELEGVEE